MNVLNVLKKPVVSEKSNERRETIGYYTFEVNSKACKDQISKAIEKTYDVKVENVRTLVRPGKTKRRGRTLFKSKAKKVAIIKLAEGQKLPIFEDNV